MKNCLILNITTLSLFFAGLAFAQNKSPAVGKLSADLAKTAKSLNPQYLVFTPKQTLDSTVPLVIYLHGAGGVGDNIQKIRGQAGQVWKGIEKFKKNPCIVVAPQASKRARENGGWVPADLNILLGYLKATLKVDEKRIYLTGNSMGGYGSWVWGGHNPGLVEATIAATAICHVVMGGHGLWL